MAEATTNLSDVAADRISIWNNEARTQEDIRTVFVNNTQIKPATRVEQQVRLVESVLEFLFPVV